MRRNSVAALVALVLVGLAIGVFIFLNWDDISGWL